LKGIILAGGAGSRLYPLSKVASKQLQPVYDKPMIYYPLSTLMLGGIRDILLISTPEDVPRFRQLLGDGSQWGLNISYTVQPSPDGLAQAFILGEEFLAGDSATLVLGDNIFYGKIELEKIIGSFQDGAKVFGYQVSDPERYGVVEFDGNGKVVGLEEKPSRPKSHYAVPGLYIYDGNVCARARALKPSPRGELEITDLNKSYLADGKLSVSLFSRGIAWLDTGTHGSLLEASHFIGTLEARQGLKIACLEEIAFQVGFISEKEFLATISAIPKCPYRDYLEKRLREMTEENRISRN
jgi:glucose-1-phosphate thymidylyltransferase